MQNEGHNVVIAADKGPLAFLQKAFPETELVRFPGFEPEYSKKDSQVWKLVASVPRAYFAFRHDHKMIRQLVRDYSIDLIISDNRFGCWCRNVKSIYITHQLHIQMPKGFRWAGFLINFIHRLYMRHYDEIWVPDIEDETTSLAGRLSHPKINEKTKYIGFLSRFSQKIQKEENPDIDYLVILSGPEPQRSILENLILEKARTSNKRFVILRALPENSETPAEIPANVTTFNHVEDTLFTELIANSREIICRGGYSSLMDLAILGQGAILIPTPGQTEQEFLAEHLDGKNGYRKVLQKDLTDFSF